MAVVTKEQAEAVLDVLHGMYDDTLYLVRQNSHLDEPGVHGYVVDSWTITWEEGPEDWVRTLMEVYNNPDTNPDAPVWVDPVSHWCAAIVPKSNTRDTRD